MSKLLQLHLLSIYDAETLSFASSSRSVGDTLLEHCDTIFYFNDKTHKEVEKKAEVDKLKQLKRKKSFSFRKGVKGQFKQVELKRKKEYRKPMKETTSIVSSSMLKNITYKSCKAQLNVHSRQVFCME
jgi:hypothetical protein